MIREVSLVLLVLLAGCGAPNIELTPRDAGPTTETVRENQTRTTTSTDIEWTETVFSRTKTLLDADVPDPNRLVIENYTPDEIDPGPASHFQRTWGIRPRADAYSYASGDGAYDSDSGTIYLYRAPATPKDELVYFAVHEFTHHVQHHRGMRDTVNNRLPAENSHRLTAVVIEGAAVYAGHAYAETYGLSYNPLAALEAEYESSGPFRRSQLAPYYFGAKYVADRISSPRELDDVYDKPPQTMETVLHGPTSSDSATPITVQSQRAGNWSLTDIDTRGELTLRLVLETGVDRDIAKAAATGWDGDRLATYTNGEQTGYVWITHWDTSADAREFESAANLYVDGTNATGTVAVVGHSDRTVVLAAGPAPFVTEMGVIIRGGESVTVELAMTENRTT